MDKKIFRDFKNIYKFLFTILTTILVGIYVIVRYFDTEIRIFYYFIIVYVVLMLVPTVYFILCITLFKLRKNELKSKDCIREIPYDYSPAMASFILDENIDILLDIKAVKINMLLNGYLKEEDGFYIIIEKNPENLKKHERYVYECIKANEWIIENIFQKCLYEDLLKEGYIIEKKKNIFLKILKGIITIVGFYYVCFGISKIIPIIFNLSNDAISKISVSIFMAYILLLPFLLAIVFRVKSKYKRTDLGKKHAVQWKKLKNFINDFTTINEKDEEYYILLEKFIPYAIGLGMAEKIENNIFNEYNEKNKSIIDKYKIQ